MQINDLRNKKIAVLGFGVNNRELVFWLLHHQIYSITICDQDIKIKNQIAKIKKTNQNVKRIVLKSGTDYLDNLDKFDIVVRSPGIPYLHPKLQAAKKAGVIISSQTETFLKLAPCRIIGVTGTKGKSTTAAMIAHLLEKSKIKNQKSKLQIKGQKYYNRVYLAGNIGKDPFGFIDDLTKNDVVVLELSSFQLQGLSVSPHVAVITGVTADHLDHHRDLAEYYEAKEAIVLNQSADDFAIINVDELFGRRLAHKAKSQVIKYSGKQKIDKGVYVGVGSSGLGKVFIADDNHSKILRSSGGEEAEMTGVIGKHNLENWAAAAAVGYYVFNIEPEDCRQALKSFMGLPHRLEFLKEIKGVRYYNDSYSTNPASTISAVESFPKSSVILICGGSSKSADFHQLAQTIVRQKVKKIIAIGEEGPKIIKEVKKVKDQKNDLKIIRSKDFRKAVQESLKNSSRGDVVLFSPACASFDMFQNATDRGEQFKKIVESFANSKFYGTIVRFRKTRGN